MHVVSEINSFLDQLSASGEYLHENEEKILGYVRAMKSLGFNSPFASLVYSTRQELEDAGADELADQKKQLGHFRYLASLKKFTLNRARVALSAHRIARHASSYKSGWKAPLEITPFLPFGGNYIDSLYRAGDAAIVAYREFSENFSMKQSKSGSVVATIEHGVLGSTMTSKVRLSSDKGLEMRVKRAYGQSAKILAVSLAKTQDCLIKNKSVRVALICAAAACMARDAKEELAKGRESELLAKYNSILASHKIVADSVLDNIEGYKDVKGLLANGGFGGFEGETFKTNKEILSLVKSRRLKARKIMERGISRLVLLPILRHYITKNANSRGKNSPFPSLVECPSEVQLAALEMLDKSHKGAKNIGELVHGKLLAESGFPANASEEFGIGCTISLGISGMEGICSLFEIDEGKAQKFLQEYESIMGGRGGKFLKHLKG